MLNADNFRQAGYRDQRPFAVLVSDPDSGAVVDGLIGRASMGLLCIDRFFLPKRMRKQVLSTRIIEAAEAEDAPAAPARCCSPSISRRPGSTSVRVGRCSAGSIARICMTKKLADFCNDKPPQLSVSGDSRTRHGLRQGGSSTI